MGLSRQEYWSELSYPPPGDLPNPGFELGSPALQAHSIPSEPPENPKNTGVGSLSLLQEIFLIPRVPLLFWCSRQDPAWLLWPRLPLRQEGAFWNPDLILSLLHILWSFPMPFPSGSVGKESCNAGDLDLIPGQEDPLEKGMATHSSILAWRIPRTEEPGGLQSMESQRVGHDWATNTFTLIPFRIKFTFLLLACKPRNPQFLAFIVSLGSFPTWPCKHPILFSCIKDRAPRRAPWECRHLCFHRCPFTGNAIPHLYLGLSCPSFPSLCFPIFPGPDAQAMVTLAGPGMNRGRGLLDIPAQHLSSAAQRALSQSELLSGALYPCPHHRSFSTSHTELLSFTR